MYIRLFFCIFLCMSQDVLKASCNDAAYPFAGLDSLGGMASFLDECLSECLSDESWEVSPGNTEECNNAQLIYAFGEDTTGSYSLLQTSVPASHTFSNVVSVVAYSGLPKRQRQKPKRYRSDEDSDCNTNRPVVAKKLTGIAGEKILLRRQEIQKKEEAFQKKLEHLRHVNAEQQKYNPLFNEIFPPLGIGNSDMQEYERLKKVNEELTGCSKTQPMP